MSSSQNKNTPKKTMKDEFQYLCGLSEKKDEVIMFEEEEKVMKGENVEIKQEKVENKTQQKK